MLTELPTAMLGTAAAVMGLSEFESTAALLLAVVSGPVKIARLLLRMEPAARAEVPPIAIPIKEGKTALLLGLLAFAFDPRLVLGGSTSLQSAVRNKVI